MIFTWIRRAAAALALLSLPACAPADPDLAILRERETYISYVRRVCDPSEPINSDTRLMLEWNGVCSTPGLVDSPVLPSTEPLYPTMVTRVCIQDTVEMANTVQFMVNQKRSGRNVKVDVGCTCQAVGCIEISSIPFGAQLKLIPILPSWPLRLDSNYWNRPRYSVPHEAIVARLGNYISPIALETSGLSRLPMRCLHIPIRETPSRAGYMAWCDAEYGLVISAEEWAETIALAIAGLEIGPCSRGCEDPDTDARIVQRVLSGDLK